MMNLQQMKFKEIKTDFKKKMEELERRMPN